MSNKTPTKKSGLFTYPTQWAIRLSHTVGYLPIQHSEQFAIVHSGLPTYSTQWAIRLSLTVGYLPIQHGGGLFAY